MYIYKHKKRYKIKIIPVICAVLSVVIVIAGLYFLFFKKDPYEAYKTYQETNKKYGEVENYSEDNDNFYISVFYPKFKDKTLNTIVKETYNDLIKQEKKKKDQKDILYMDYACDYIFKQYVVIEYDFKRVDEKTEKETNFKKVMTYNQETKTLISLKDCLHGKYSDMFKNLGIEQYDKNSVNIKVGEKSFTYYPEDNMKNGITIEYEANKDYIKLANKNIPSNVPLDVKAPKYMKVDNNKKMVAITLDDGPHKTLTDQAMTAFEKYGGRGTFFELGEKMAKNPDVVKDVYERGHEIGSHTYSHAQLTKLDADKLDEEIRNTQNTCFNITGSEPTLVRPPYGLRNDNVKNAFQSYDLTMILWDGDTEDWRYSKKDDGAQTICDNIIRDTKAGTGDGNIVLIHDIHANSVKGLEMALEKLDADGYQFVTVSDLLKYRGHRDYK